VREQRITLEHHVDRAIEGRQFNDAAAIEIDLAVGRFLEARKATQQGRLAAAGGTEQGKDLALADGQADVVDGTEAVVFLGQVVDANVVFAQRLGFRTGGRSGDGCCGGSHALSPKKEPLAVGRGVRRLTDPFSGSSSGG
jgi:hypothetical protein